MLVAKTVSKVGTNKSDERTRRSAQARMYAPRPPLAAPAPAVVEDMRLRRLTAQVLDALKLPGAIPSRVLMEALAQAKALGSAR